MDGAPPSARVGASEPWGLHRRDQGALTDRGSVQTGRPAPHHGPTRGRHRMHQRKIMYRWEPHRRRLPTAATWAAGY